MSGRIRSIKPEWLNDEIMASASDEARVLSVALILMADDHGRGRASLASIAAETWRYQFASEDVAKVQETLAKASRALRELVAMNFVVVYEVDKQRYFEIRNWTRHQRVDKPGKPRVPAPQPQQNGRVGQIREDFLGIPEDSLGIPEALAKIPGTLATDQERRSIGAGEDSVPSRKLPEQRPPELSTYQALDRALNEINEIRQAAGASSRVALADKERADFFDVIAHYANAPDPFAAIRESHRAYMKHANEHERGKLFPLSYWLRDPDRWLLIEREQAKKTVKRKEASKDPPPQLGLGGLFPPRVQP